MMSFSRLFYGRSGRYPPGLEWPSSEIGSAHPLPLLNFRSIRKSRIADRNKYYHEEHCPVCYIGRGSEAFSMAERPVVLVVEDEFLIRMRAADMIEDAGFKVVEAADADQAILILESRT